MNNSNLKKAIENLYRAFTKYPLKTGIEGCPCCVGKHENRTLHSKPLRELSGDELSLFGFKAMTTFGDSEDFKHFLPRLFEIIVEEDFGYNEEILFHKLDYGNWQIWDQKEKAALETFFFELFRAAVNFDEERAYLTETYLVGIAAAVEEITPYLGLWLEKISLNKIITLRYFVVDCDCGRSNAFHAGQPAKSEQIRNWLISGKTVSILEDLFFNDANFKEVAELPEILDAIYQLKTT